MRDGIEPGLRPAHTLHILEATGGGTMRYMENLAEASAGINMVFGFAYSLARAGSGLAPFLERIQNNGWRTFPIDMRREINASVDFLALRQLRRVIKDFSPDILHCHSSKAGALGRLAGTMQRSQPLRLYSPHALATPLGDKYLTIEKVLARFTDRFIAVSESERAEIIQLGLAKRENVDVIYPSIDFEHFKPASKPEARKVLGLGPDPIVLNVGRVTQQKNPAAFIEIMKLLHAKRPGVRGIWVGSFDGDKEFCDAIDAAGLTGVISLVPWQHDVRNYIAAADVFLSTSTFESFGYVTAEAMAMHLPVVASDVTGTRDIMREELRQWLYRPGDYDAASEMIFRLLADANNAEQVAIHGRQIMMRNFTTERMREALISAYTSALGNSNAQLNPGAPNGLAASFGWSGRGRRRDTLPVRFEKN